MFPALKDPTVNKLGTLRVDVEPVAPTRWNRFKDWLRATVRFVMPKGRSVRHEVQAYAEVAIEAGKARLLEPMARTAQLEAAVAEGLMKARHMEIEGTRAAELLYADRDVREAEAAKLREEAAMIKTRRHLEALKLLRENGYLAIPLLEGGELVGLYLSRPDELPRPSNPEPEEAAKGG